MNKLREIVKHIPGFKINNTSEHGGSISNGEIEVYVRLNGWPAGKGHASVSWPRDENGSCMSAENWRVVDYNTGDPAQCGFNPTKDSRAIARDIQRKVIDPGLPLMALVNAKLIKAKAVKEAREKGIASLGILLNEQVHGQSDDRLTKMYSAKDEDEDYPDQIYLEVLANHDTFSVNVSRLSLREATKLIKQIERMAPNE